MWNFYMQSKILKYIGPVIGIAIFIIALIALRNELHSFHYHQITAEISNVPAVAIGMAFLFTILNYLVLSFYEIEGFQYIKHPIKWRKIGMASFIAFAFSNNVGFYSISGSAVRFRFYSAWGLSAFDITKLITYCSVLAFWLGLCTISSIVFLVEPLEIPGSLHLPVMSTKIVGIVLALTVCVFLVFTILRRKPIKVFNWIFDIPPFWLSLALIFTACLDWVFFGAALYSLLPIHSSVSFPLFMGYFLLAMIIALISHVPGGLGVFETMFMLLLHGQAPATSMFGALLVFRLIYYIIPFGLSVVILTIHEVYIRKEAFLGVSKVVSKWATTIIPYIFAIAVFASGVVLLFSGATPGVQGRIELLQGVMPLTLLEISHFMGSIIGAMLLMLSWGIYKRLDSAYYTSIYALVGGIFMSLLKGLDYEEAIVLLAAILFLLPCKKHFYRKSSLIHEQLTFGWAAAVLAVIAGSVWLGFFANQHVTYSNELWWHFSFFGHASRFLRASAGSAVVIIAAGLLKLLTPAKPFRISNDEFPDETMRLIINKYKKTYAYLAFLGDKKFLLSDNNDAFIMYGIQGKSWVALGDPVGESKSIMQLIWNFREVCDLHDGRPVFYEVSKENLHLYVDIGLTLIKMGEAAKVDLQKFSLDGGSKKGFRYTLRKLEQEGCVFEIIDKESVATVLPELRIISDLWLQEKNTREKRFSLGNFSEQYMSEFECGIVKKNGKIVAFTNIWKNSGKYEISIDLMRYSKDAPKSVMEYIFVKLIVWGKSNGYEWFDLGMAPLSGFEDHALASLWSKIGSFIYEHGENFYNFQGLRGFKEKFDPIWEPKYLACPAGIVLPFVLRDTATLISGGVKGVLSK
jgi:phosphatidylglycerol lysyltransferase